MLLGTNSHYLSGRSMDSTTENDGVSDSEFADELKPGTTLLHGQYVIEGFLNSGGFGMTYLAKDSLERTVVIKECFPASFCCRSETTVHARSRSQQKEFKSIVRLFMQEARRLSQLNHPNIVGVHQVFEDNETAYMALDYIDGQDLLDIVEDDNRTFDPSEIQRILLKMLEAVSFIHEQDILHRDISPDNILLDHSGNPVLIDFGAAREKATKASRALSALLVVKDGYSPQEFYIAGGKQGPSSDLYALAATFYHLITGAAPMNSQQRLVAIAAKEIDPYVPLVGQITGYEREFLATIDQALQVFPKDRVQTAHDWMIAIDQEKRTAVALEKAQNDKTTEIAISRLVTETNQAVMEDLQRNECDIAGPGEATQSRKKTTAPVAARSTLTPVLHDQLNTDEDPYASKGRWFRNQTGKRTARRFWIFGKQRTDHFGKAGP